MKEKIIATFLTAITLLSTFGSAALAAYDLGDYPTFLFEDHNLDAYVVVGADAAPADVVGAVDLATRLAGESYEEVSAVGGVTVTGGESDDIPIGKAVSASGFLDTEFTDDDLAGLQDSSVTFQGDSYNFHDEIVLLSTSPKICSSLNCSEDDYGTGVYMEARSGALKYYYIFDETINISAATSSNPLTIDLMGKTIKITSVSTQNKFTAYVGDSYALSIGDSVTVEGKTVTLNNVGNLGTVLVDIDGTVYTISGTETHGGIEIAVDDWFYSDTLSERAATLIMGKDAVESYQNGDRYLKDDSICNDDPDDTDCWLWIVNGLLANAAGDKLTTDVGPTLGVQSDWVINDDTDNPITVGGCYNFPNDFASVCIDSLTVSDDDYTTITFEPRDGVTLGASTDQYTWHIQSSVTDALQVDAGNVNILATDKRTSEIWLVLNTSTDNVTVWYLGTDGTKTRAGDLDNATHATTATEFARVYYGDTKGTDVELKLIGDTMTANALNITIDIAGKSSSDLDGGADDIKMQLRHDAVTASSPKFTGLGATLNTEEANELQWGSGPINIGTKDEDHRSMYGILILDPESHGASDEVVIKVPNEQVMAVVIVKGPATTVAEAAGEVTKKVVPVTTAVAKLDTEIADPATVGKDLVLVGGPAVNKHTAAAMGLSYPTYGASGLLPFAEGEGYIKVFEDVFTTGQQVVVVAGWAAADTRNAASVLQQYASFASQLDGNVAVKVTSVTAAGIVAA